MAKYPYVAVCCIPMLHANWLMMVDPAGGLLTNISFREADSRTREGERTGYTGTEDRGEDWLYWDRGQRSGLGELGPEVAVLCFDNKQRS